MGNIYYIKYLLVVFCFALFLRFFFFFNLGFALKIRIIYSMFTNCVYTLKIVVDTITDGLPFSLPFPPLPTSTQPLASLPWPSLCCLCLWLCIYVLWLLFSPFIQFPLPPSLFIYVWRRKRKVVVYSVWRW